MARSIDTARGTPAEITSSQVAIRLPKNDFKEHSKRVGEGRRGFSQQFHEMQAQQRNCFLVVGRLFLSCSLAVQTSVRKCMTPSVPGAVYIRILMNASYRMRCPKCEKINQAWRNRHGPSPTVGAHFSASLNSSETQSGTACCRCAS